jgi:SAM-dependent methyltransferase
VKRILALLFGDDKRGRRLGSAPVTTPSDVGVASAVEAWNLVRARFPFPDYMERDAGHIAIGQTVTRYLRSGGRILDFGAGPCDKTAVVAALGYKCTAADDLGDEWHRVAENRMAILAFAESFGIEYVPMDGSNLPFLPDTFDMVMLHDVLEHLHDSPRSLLIDLLQAVRPEGYLFITVPNHVNLRKRLDVLRGRTSLPMYPMYYWYPDPWRGHVREYTRGDCNLLADYLDLDIVELRGTHQMLEKVPPRLLRLYLLISRLAPDTRDTWLMVARKRPRWNPKRALEPDDFRRVTGLPGWSTAEGADVRPGVS